MILVIDNFDSFTYNLVQILGEIVKKEKKILIFRNNQLTLQQIEKMNPNSIVISPGPCTPNEAGISTSIFQHFHKKKPILGVCLGHQCLGAAFGGKIVRAEKLMHGKTSEIYHQGISIFKGIKNPFTATRYHSLLVEKKSCPKSLKVTAWTKEGEIMGLMHRDFPWIVGVQFHPESILTLEGKKIISNFLKILPHK
ncbi:MAG: anthranilate/aminodeoxychorismate synthase component II [Elusimicrobia bacterium RIFCSPLOWO2_02_FULL_39_32]|nr:MAG: anthranilate/aminodeoxychorismate synthase component II [Elusimicrobia bacterium GWA2_38_7]OGR79333.1 MAG: anthranilate/aminodeoxychorismate synthase component II [Elusimicrobia bacterium RIFCSPHIGHO2_02_FULL_39_36]OGR93233.1 MAG: anthranilate/aminodeoxychorismate synthase component II [Elusimicrobia bacterium RIFCSPLOWO2_02_FULL_39_32]OGR99457.1 MAG: anthranilate/aminodeoxychorismate synthase component II [Elusimicrobia bacterium RIFCSPLOWO2_12_FULL_39_28]